LKKTASGQTLIELALVLPLILTLALGTYWSVSAVAERDAMSRAAYEGAVVGAQQHGKPAICRKAIAAAKEVYAKPVNVTCKTISQMVVITLDRKFPIAIPFFDATFWKLQATGRAEMRND